MLTMKQTFDNFLSYLKSADYSDHGINRYKFSVTDALPKWLFRSSLCSIMYQYSVVDFLPNVNCLMKTVSCVQQFIEYATTSSSITDISTAISDYEIVLRQKGHTHSWIRIWKIALYAYGTEVILHQSLESMNFLLLSILPGNILINSRQSTGYIIKFIKYLHAHGQLKSDIPWENIENWKQRLLDTLFKASGIILTNSSTFEDFLLGYLDYCYHEKEFTLKSIQHEQRYLAIFLSWVNKSVGSIEISQLTGELIKEFINSLAARNLLNISVRHHLNTIKGFASFLIEYGLIQSNPASEIKLKANERRPKNVLTLKERDDLLCVPLKIFKEKHLRRLPHANSNFFLLRDMCILNLFVNTGIRLQEISEIKLSDIDLDDKSILIKGKGSRSIVSKGRTVFLDHPGTFYSISSYLKIRSEIRSPWFFITLDGIKLQTPSFQDIVASYGKLAGIDKRLNPRLLRASFASFMVENGIDPVALKELMGHSSIRTTFSHYVFLKQEHVHKAWSTYNPLSIILSEKGKNDNDDQTTTF